MLVKAGHECKSRDTHMGSFGTVDECAAAVTQHGGKYFVYGTGRKAGKCYVEKTSDATCSEGWESDLYDFYGFDPSEGTGASSGGRAWKPGVETERVGGMVCHSVCFSR